MPTASNPYAPHTAAEPPPAAGVVTGLDAFTVPTTAKEAAAWIDGDPARAEAAARTEEARKDGPRVTVVAAVNAVLPARLG